MDFARCSLLIIFVIIFALPALCDGQVVDMTPPKVTIRGVINGQQIIAPAAVVPIIDASDDSPGSPLLEVTVNGIDYIPGTSISKPGRYNIAAVAHDLAGNMTRKSVLFEIREYPLLRAALYPIEIKRTRRGGLVHLDATVAVTSDLFDVGEIAPYSLRMRAYDRFGRISGVNSLRLVEETTGRPQVASAAVVEQCEMTPTAAATPTVTIPEEQPAFMSLVSRANVQPALKTSQTLGGLQRYVRLRFSGSYMRQRPVRDVRSIEIIGRAFAPGMKPKFDVVAEARIPSASLYKVKGVEKRLKARGITPLASDEPFAVAAAAAASGPCYVSRSYKVLPNSQQESFCELPQPWPFSSWEPYLRINMFAIDSYISGYGYTPWPINPGINQSKALTCGAFYSSQEIWELIDGGRCKSPSIEYLLSSHVSAEAWRTSNAMAATAGGIVAIGKPGSVKVSAEADAGVGTNLDPEVIDFGDISVGVGIDKVEVSMKARLNKTANDSDADGEYGQGTTNGTTVRARRLTLLADFRVQGKLRVSKPYEGQTESSRAALKIWTSFLTHEVTVKCPDKCCHVDYWEEFPPS